MKTPDPTPVLLTPARLAEIRAIATSAPANLYAEPDPGATCDECGEHCGERGTILRTPGGGGALLVLSDDNDAETVAFHREARGMVLELVRHLDALTPRAPVDGGRLLYYALHPTAHERAWETHDTDLRARYDAQAESLDATGYVRGLYAAHRLSAQDIAEQSATIARLTTSLDAARDEYIAATERADIAEARAGNLAAELAEARDLATELRAMEAEALASADRWRAASERHEAEVVNLKRREDATNEAARLDGAREEREACALIAEDEERLLYRQDGEQACARVRRRIRARTTEGRQG